MTETTTPTRTEVVPAFLRPPEAARFLALRKHHLGDLYRKGIIPGIKQGRKCLLFNKCEQERAIMRLQEEGKINP